MAFAPMKRGRGKGGATGSLASSKRQSSAGVNVGAAEKAMANSRGEPMPRGLAGELGATLGESVEGVVLHRDAAAAEAARTVEAHAFATSNHIFFGEGTWSPSSAMGRKLLLHETRHVQQFQRGALRSGGSDRVSRPASSLEQEAEQAAARPWARASAPAESDPRVNVLPFRSDAPIMRWWCPGSAVDDEPRVRKTERDAKTIADCLMEMGVEEDAIGDLSAVTKWSDMRINDTFFTLDQIRRGKVVGSEGHNLSGTAAHRKKKNPNKVHPGRIIQSWNKGQDDLGVGDTYANILEFVDALNQTARATMGEDMDYLDAVAAMPRVFVGGVTVYVHPRAVYWVAAAQVGMDVRSGVPEIEAAQGHGHYVPAGGFRESVNDIRKVLKLINKGDKKKNPLPGGAEAYNRMLVDLLQMDRVLQEQAGGPDVAGHNPQEHREPLMRSYFATRRKRLQKLQPLTDDDQAPEAAGKLREFLGDLPGRSKVQHLFGSVDPHGTDHALGLAIDAFKGMGAGGGLTNAGFKGREEVFYIIISRWGPETEKYGPPYEALDTNKLPKYATSLSAGQALSLTRLVREHAEDLPELVDSSAQRFQPPPSLGLDGKTDHEVRVALAAARKKLGNFRKRLSLAFKSRAGKLGKVKNDKKLRRELGESGLELLEQQHARLQEAAALSKSLGPAELEALLSSRIAGLEAAMEAALAFESDADLESAKAADIEDLAAAFDKALTNQFLDRYSDARADWKEAKRARASPTRTRRRPKPSGGRSGRSATAASSYPRKRVRPTRRPCNASTAATVGGGPPTMPSKPRGLAPGV